MPKRRTFAVPPAKSGGRKAREGKAAKAPARAPRTFAVPPAPMSLTDVLEHGGEDHQGFPGMPRNPCECGATWRLSTLGGAVGYDPAQLVSTPHQRDCLFVDWPRVVTVTWEEWTTPAVAPLARDGKDKEN